MKIHGTAKGGAISKKDFGVAFSSGGGGTGIDDTGLKAYYKFNETSGDITNVSESDDSIGSSANIQITGASYNQDDGSPFEYSMLFDGTNDFGAFGTSTSIWNYQHSTTAQWSRVFWMRLRTEAEEAWLLGNTESNTGSYNYLPNDEIYQAIRNATGQSILSSTTSGNMIPNTTSWNMYSITCDLTLDDTNLIIQRNGANEETFDKTANTPTNGNAVNARTIARKSGASSQFGHFNIAELSEWSVVLDQDAIDKLYNSGSGQAIY